MPRNLSDKEIDDWARRGAPSEYGEPDIEIDWRSIFIALGICALLFGICYLLGNPSIFKSK